MIHFDHYWAPTGCRQDQEFRFRIQGPAAPKHVFVIKMSCRTFLGFDRVSAGVGFWPRIPRIFRQVANLFGLRPGVGRISGFRLRIQDSPAAPQKLIFLTKMIHFDHFWAPSGCRQDQGFRLRIQDSPAAPKHVFLYKNESFWTFLGFDQVSGRISGILAQNSEDSPAALRKHAFP